ncbi:MAG: CvpA family protein [Lactobacillus sp.]|jgi:uncharacterized membrane protein required for colicin V production|nr:CvpA family protein [Lactobacillus sp.]MCH3905977.1 CvpA family protein [Lactobacillus sp.]MCH3990449.1 CvpA family protein [Lactobacillus sp.]MCH4068836.1 CvpA family protein [Lactobacillus sp.]MCI1304461.1 CvpA family protein [Lactobacillus sp.]
MVTLLILIIFVYFGYVAYRRGLALEALTAVGFALSLLVATLLYRPIGQAITLWIPYPSASRASKFAFFDQTAGLKLDKSFYAAFAFAIVFVICFALWHLVMSGFGNLQFITGEPQIDKWASILISVIMTQIGCYLFLFLLSTLPFPGLQTALSHSIAANALLKFSPGITPFFINLFVTNI